MKKSVAFECTLSMRIITKFHMGVREYIQWSSRARSLESSFKFSSCRIRGGRVLIAYFLLSIFAFFGCFSRVFFFGLLLLVVACSLPQSFVLSLTMAMSLRHSSSLSVSVRQEFKWSIKVFFFFFFLFSVASRIDFFSFIFFSHSIWSKECIESKL